MSPLLAIAAIVLALATAFIAAMAGVGGGFLYVPILTLIFGLAQRLSEQASLLSSLPLLLLQYPTYDRDGSSSAVRSA